jgi:hypothetical protein
MAQDNYEEKYTDPELRRQIKEEIQRSDKGGKPGQWSARKSQFLVQEYEKRGGGYKQDRKDEAAQSLEEWSEQDWQTESGDAQAHQGEVTKRYLPKTVWEQLSDTEKQEAEHSKNEASKQGKQHVDWTPAVKQAMHEAEPSSNSHKHPPANQPTKPELYEQAKDLKIAGRSKMTANELETAIEKATRKKQ